MFGTGLLRVGGFTIAMILVVGVLTGVMAGVSADTPENATMEYDDGVFTIADNSTDMHATDTAETNSEPGWYENVSDAVPSGPQLISEDRAEKFTHRSIDMIMVPMVAVANGVAVVVVRLPPGAQQASALLANVLVLAVPAAWAWAKIQRVRRMGR